MTEAAIITTLIVVILHYYYFTAQKYQKMAGVCRKETGNSSITKEKIGIHDRIKDVRVPITKPITDVVTLNATTATTDPVETVERHQFEVKNAERPGVCSQKNSGDFSKDTNRRRMAVKMAEIKDEVIVAQTGTKKIPEEIILKLWLSLRSMQKMKRLASQSKLQFRKYQKILLQLHQN